jgi:hypothetical protein
MFPAANVAGGIWRGLHHSERGIAACLQDINSADAEDEQDRHDHQKRPSLTFGADHASEAVGQGRAERKD